MWFGVVTLFPDMIMSGLEGGVIGRSCSRGQLEVRVFNPRDHAHDKHRTVDDRPYGGGPGMLMKVQPLEDALAQAREEAPSGTKVVYLSPQGRRMNQSLFEEAKNWPGVILVCGRYEGVDERLIGTEIDQEWSLGDFVLSGGEIAALAVVDGIGRLVPGVLGHSDSADQDSFSRGLLDCPHYTRPEHYKGLSVPAVLLSGNHEAIRRWRLRESLKRTMERRPELLDARPLDKEETQLLEEIRREAD